MRFRARLANGFVAAAVAAGGVVVPVWVRPSAVCRRLVRALEVDRAERGRAAGRPAVPKPELVLGVAVRR